MFTSIHNHSEFSNLRFRDCTIKPNRMIDKAIELGYKGVCLTDHEAVSGHVRFLRHYHDLKKDRKLPEGFKIGLGNEIYLVDHEGMYDEEGKVISVPPMYHFVLVAKDRAGNDQLRRLSTNAWYRWFRDGPAERVPTFKKLLEAVVGDDPNHLIASTACLGGELPRMILEGRDYKPFLRWLVSVFGKDSVFLELQPREMTNENAGHEQFVVNRTLLSLAEATGVRPIVTTDSHYLTKKDRFVHEAFLKSDPTNSGSRELEDFYEYTYMMDEDEIRSMLNTHLPEDKTQQIINNTMVIHDMLEDYELEQPVIVPVDRNIGRGGEQAV